MSFLKNNSNIISLLRLIAVVGTIAAALMEFFSSPAVQPNQHYSFYALAIVAVGVGVSILAFLRQTVSKVLKNPDILVPIGLYITVNQLSGYLIQIPNIIFLNAAGFNFASISLSLAFFWIFYIVINVCFIGWMTRTVLQFARNGKVDLIKAFQDVQWWFPRTFAVMLAGWLPIFLLMWFLVLPFLSGGSRGMFSGVVLSFIIFNIIFSLLWNLATAAIFPYVLLVKRNLKQTIPLGIRFSWRNRRKTFLPVVLLMLVSGWIVYISVTYTVQETEEKGEFGEYSSFSSETTTRNWNFSTHFIWTADYEEKSKWHESLIKAVKQEPLATVDFRIMVLLLIFSLIVNLRIVESIWGKNVGIDDARNQISPRFVVTASILLVLFFAPFEYLKSNKPGGANAANPTDLTVSKIYAGENLFTKKEFFKIGWHETTGLGQKDTLPNILPIGRIANFSIIGENVVIAGSENALILDKNGNPTKKIHFRLGETQDENNRKAYFTDVEIVDIEEDGQPGFAGKGSYPNAAFVLDSNGKILFRHQGKKIDVNTVDVKDLDADGKKEILVDDGGTLKVFNLNGSLKWSQPVPTSTLGDNLYFLDTDGDGKNEIVINNFRAGKIIEPKTEKVKSIKKPIEQQGFLIQKKKAAQILFFDQNKLGLFDFEGNLNAKYDAPLSDIEDTRLFKDKDILMSKFAEVFIAKALRFKLKAGEPEYLAVLATLATKLDSYFVDIIYIYDADGNLVYQESLANGNGQIKAFPNENETESLLISENEIIWLYTGN